MGLIRDIPVTVVAHEDHFFGTCSAIQTTAETTSPETIGNTKTTASALVSTGDIGDVDNDEQGAAVSSGGIVTSTFAKIIDRLRWPLGAHYQAASVVACLTSTAGSTEADRKLALGVRLFHGDSSGGGDLAELSTGMRPRDRIYHTSARTSDMESWDDSESTGALNIFSNPGIYDLRAAKRYLQVRPRFGKNSVTTETSGDEASRASALVTFFGGDVIPAPLDTSSPFSTSTST